MKTKLYYLLVLLLAVGVSASAKVKDGEVMSGNSMTDLGTYSIVKSESSIVVDDKALVTYNLEYENAGKPVQIGVVNEKESTTFLVYTDEIEVQYVSRDGYFGVEKMDKKYRRLDAKKANSRMDRLNYHSQRVLTQKPKTEKEFLGLIACYFPVLVEQQYQADL